MAKDSLERPVAREIVEATWILRDQVDAEGSIHFPTGLGVGEVTSILLAQQLKADWIILDDGQARKAATKVGLQVIGCVGILERSYRNGDVVDLREACSALLRARAYVTLALVNAALRGCGLQPILD